MVLRGLRNFTASALNAAVTMSAVGMLAACDRAEPAASKTQTNPALEARLSALEKTVADLSAETMPSTAVLAPGSGGYVVIRTSSGMPLRFGADDLKPSGNGSQIELQIGNPSSVSLRDCELSISWAEVNSRAEVIQETSHKITKNLAEPIPAGDFFRPVIQLDDIPPAKLGRVWVNDVRCRRWLKG